jgi:hypothetical protein
MKIIERHDWVMVYSCTGNGNGGKGCNSLLEVAQDDLRYFEEQEYPWRTQPEAVCFKCPVCNAVTDIPKKDWPANHTNLEKWSSHWRDDDVQYVYV